MRILHLADLHFGKSIHGVSLLENGDQGYWVERFLELADAQRPDAILIAGDVYDRSSPSGEAVELLSRMLTGLAERKIPVLMVAGNHDSAQRLAFARPMLARQGLHISRPLFGSDQLEKVTLRDEYGPVSFWLMPYVYPALIARGESVQRIEGGRLPLGILDRVTPAASRVRLMAGDTVLLASDGVMDAADPQALEALLTAPGDDMNALSEGVLALAQAADGPRDDMTVVCVRVRDSE